MHFSFDTILVIETILVSTAHAGPQVKHGQLEVAEKVEVTGQYEEIDGAAEAEFAIDELNRNLMDAHPRITKLNENLVEK
jgi:hypothetical protein